MVWYLRNRASMTVEFAENIVPIRYSSGFQWGAGLVNQSTMTIVIERAQRVMQLQQPVFRTIARDPNATKQAAIVVAVVAIASAIGGADEGAGGIFVGLIGAFLGWLIYAGMAWFFGTNIFGTPTTVTNWESLLRTLGYAQAPGILSIFGFIPLLGWIAALVGGIWAIVTAIIAIRETLGFGTGRAIITAIVAAIASAMVAAIIALLFGVGVSF